MFFLRKLSTSYYFTNYIIIKLNWLVKIPWDIVLYTSSLQKNWKPLKSTW